MLNNGDLQLEILHLFEGLVRQNKIHKQVNNNVAGYDDHRVRKQSKHFLILVHLLLLIIPAISSAPT